MSAPSYSAHPRAVAGLCRAAAILGLLLLPLGRAPAAQGRSPQPERLAPADVTTLAFEGAGTVLDTTVIHVAAGYVYLGYHSPFFSSYSSGPAVARVRLSDLTRDGTVRLPEGHIATAAVLDSASGFAYFATMASNGPGQIVRVRLSDFTAAGTLTLDPNEGGVGSAVLDTAGGYAYFGTTSQPGRVLQVRLADFTRTGTLILAPGENDLQSAVLDAARGYAYFGTNTEPGHIVRVRLADLTRVDALDLNPGENGLVAAAADSIATYAYFGTDAGRIIKVRLDEFSPVDSLQLDTGYGYWCSHLTSALIDDAVTGYAYFGLGSPGGVTYCPSVVARVRLADFTQVDSLDVGLLPYIGLVDSMAIDPSRDLAVLGVDNYSCGSEPYCSFLPSDVVQLRLSDFTVVAHVNVGENEVGGIALDNAGFGYFGLMTGQVVRVHLDDLTRVGTLKLADVDSALYTAAFDPDGGYAYFGTNTSPGRVIRVHMADLAEAGTLTLAPGEDYLHSAFIDPTAGYVYFGTSAGDLVKIRLADFTRVEALPVGPDPQCEVVDPAAGLAYVGLGNGAIAQVDLASFTVLNTLSVGSEALKACVLDNVAGYAYFADVGMDITRVRVPDLTLAGTVTIPGFEWGPRYPEAAVLDPEAGVAYWANWFPYCWECWPHCTVCGAVGSADKLCLENFEPCGGTEIWQYPHAAAIDTTAGYAYYGSWTTPGIAQQVSLGTGADLRFESASAPAAVRPGETFTYTLAVANDGPRGATQTVLTATLPVSTTFAGVSEGCSPVGSLVTCALGTVRVYASRAVTIGVTVDSAAPPGLLTLTAEVRARELDPVPANNFAEVTTALVIPRQVMPVVSY